MSDYQRRLGSRLRAIRQQQGLHPPAGRRDLRRQVEGRRRRLLRARRPRRLRRQAGRAVRVLQRPGLRAAAQGRPRRRAIGASVHASRVMLDLRRCRVPTSTRICGPCPASRTPIQLQRGDYNGNVLTIRGEDLRALSVIYGTDPEDLVDPPRTTKAILATAASVAARCAPTGWREPGAAVGACRRGGRRGSPGCCRRGRAASRPEKPSARSSRMIMAVTALAGDALPAVGRAGRRRRRSARRGARLCSDRSNLATTCRSRSTT